MKIGRLKFGSDASKEDEYNDPPKPFMEHLIELRNCLVKCAFAWAICVIVIIPFAPMINNWIIDPARITRGELGFDEDKPTVTNVPPAAVQGAAVIDTASTATNAVAETVAAATNAVAEAIVTTNVIAATETNSVATSAITPVPPVAPPSPVSPTRNSDELIVQTQALSWTDGFVVLMQITMWGGTILALPFLLCFILQFIFPGLKRSEKNILIFTLATSSVFFVSGALMAYATTLRFALRFFIRLNHWMGIPTTIINMKEHISIVIKILLGFGVAFQFPLLLLALGWLGIISSKSLASKRRIAIVVVFTIAMFLTPPDPLSQIIMALPMCILYESCIWIIYFREKVTGRISEKKENGESAS